MVRQSTSSNVNPPVAVNPQPSTQEPIVQELRALVKTQHEISGHLWWVSLSMKIGFIMMVIGLIAMLSTF